MERPSVVINGKDQQMAGYRITWTSHTGETVDLSMDSRSDSGIWIKSLDGFISDSDVATVKRTTGRGEDPTAMTIPKMSGTMVLHLDPYIAELPNTVGQLWSFTRSLFSTVKPGVMHVQLPDGTSLHAPFYLTSPISFPGGRSPHTTGIREADMTVSLWSADGGWQGQATTGTPPVSGQITLYNRGDIDGYLQLELMPGSTASSRTYQLRDEAGAAITTVTLPQVSGKRFIDTAPGTGFAIVDANGKRDRAAQVALRGQYLPGLIPTGGSINLSVGSLITPRFIPYYLTPGR